MQTTVPPAEQIANEGPIQRTGLAYVIAFVRTAIYSVLATLAFLIMTLACAPVLLIPAERTRFLFRAWATVDLTILHIVVGQRLRILNPQNKPVGPALVCAKHQSAWETLALVPLLPKGAIILKKELMKIPLYGHYAKHYGMISVDRSAGAGALKPLAEDAKAAVDRGMQIVIFPEGTRRSLGAPPDYKPGALFLYDKLKVPIVPVALNSGVFWPRGKYVKYPGTITVSFLPAIPAGLTKGEAKARLVAAIEDETARLVAEAQAASR